MLVLTRRMNEKIFIGDKGTIEVSVLGISGNQVRLGITAPRGIPVHREEIFRKIKTESGARPFLDDEEDDE